VDLAEGVLTIRAGKGGKSRLIPLHHSALEPLRAYASRRDGFGDPSGPDPFFRTDRDDHLTYDAVGSTFKWLRRRLGWSGEGRTRPPRIHDLRHRMVVQRLLAWHAEGANLDTKLTALATYLGHVLVSDLYWYFSATPELMGVVAERFAAFGEQFSAGAR
jgi:integrase/recombinase XerD